MPDIQKGINLDLSDKLTEAEKKKLVKFIARATEDSYRRGLQQGATFQQLGSFKKDPYHIRFRKNLDVAPEGQTNRINGYTSVDILDREYCMSFFKIGLYIRELFPKSY